MTIITYSTVMLAAESVEKTASTIHSDINPSLENDYEEPKNITIEHTLSAINASKKDSVKIYSTGEVVDHDSDYWDCTHQKQSGLTWEVKSKSGLRNKSNTYTWIKQGSDIGVFTAWFDQRQGKCTGKARCDTDSYIIAINQQKLCGFSDWRLPTKEELLTLVEFTTDSNEPAIDKKLFPNTLPSWYWTSITNSDSPKYAWYVLFRNTGLSLSDYKDNPKHIRLVRGPTKS